MRYLLALFLVACGGQVSTKPEPSALEQYPKKANQDRVQQIVWFEALGNLGPAPRVEWLTPDPTCIGTGVHLGGDKTKCYGGMNLPSDNKNLVVWFKTFDLLQWLYKDPPLSQTAYVHEHIHAWQAAQGYYDAEHLIKADWDLVPIINAELVRQGL